MNTDARNLQAARNLQWLFLVVAAAALLFGGSFARRWPYAIVLAAGALLNAASYLLPVKGATERRMTFYLVAQLVASLSVIALAAGFSGGLESPLYAFLLVALLLPAATCDILIVACLSAFAVLAFVLAGVLLGNAFGAAGPAFVKIALLAVFPVGLNIILSTYRRRLRDRETFATLYRISRSLGQSLDLRQVLRHLLGEMDAVFSTDISSVHVLDPATNSLVVEASGADAEEVAKEQIAIRLGEGFIGSVAKTGEPFITTDISKDARFATFPGARKKVSSAIAAPIQIGDKTVGVISCASSTRKRFNREDLDLLVSVASLAAAAIERAELYQQLLSRGEAVIESMLDGLVVVDRECRVVMTNKTSREMLGARPGMGEPLERLLKGKVAEWRRLCRDVEHKIIDGPDPMPASFSLELKVLAGKAEGRILSARVSPVTSQWNQVVGAVLLREDVTDVIRLTGELAVEKAKFETVLESVVVGVLAVSSTSEVLIANTTVFNILAMARPWWWLGAAGGWT